MMCEKCYNKTTVQTSRFSVAQGVPTGLRARICTDCGHTFNTVELPESAHKPDPSNPPGRTPFVKVPHS